MWLIAVGAIIWADLDLLKKIPIINHIPWARVIGNTATRPVNRTPSVHDCYVAQALTAGEVDVLWLGDSITGNWRASGRAVWTQEFRPLRCLNFGIPADRTQDVLWRIEHGELDGPEPRFIVLEIGANNLNRNTVEEIAEAIGVIVAFIKGRLPSTKIVVMALFPRGNRIDDPINVKVRAVNSRLISLDDGGQVRVLNIGELFADPSGDLRAAFPDGAHLSPAAYRIWAEAIRPTLQELLKRRS
jgi:lysophospholipase L1-like esterase